MFCFLQLNYNLLSREDYNALVLPSNGRQRVLLLDIHLRERESVCICLKGGGGNIRICSTQPASPTASASEDPRGAIGGIYQVFLCNGSKIIRTVWTSQPL